VKLFLILFVFSLQGFSEETRRGNTENIDDLTEEEIARERILNEYGDKDQFESANKLKANNKIDNDVTEEPSLAETPEQNTDTDSLGMDEQAIKDITEKVTKQLEAKGMGGDNLGSVDQNFLTNILDDKMKKAALEMMKNNPFASMSDAEFNSFINVRVQGTTLEKIFQNNPKILRGISSVLRDKRALPQFLTIINKPQKMKTYGFSFVGVMVLIFLMNLMQSKKSIIKRIVMKLSLMLLGSTVNLVVFYFIFKEELQPSVDAIWRVL
jgi:hypothetical protein